MRKARQRRESVENDVATDTTPTVGDEPHTTAVVFERRIVQRESIVVGIAHRVIVLCPIAQNKENRTFSYDPSPVRIGRD